MNLESALGEFRRGKKPLPDKDILRITEIVKALGVSGSYLVDKDYITDPSHIVHIHPTMVVASRAFPGAIDRGTDPYPVHRFFIALSRWRDPKKR
jgi:hypothetical protein